jgi:signal transduction histidine kinase
VRIGLGRRYAVYFSLLTLAVVATALTAAGVIAFGRASVLQGEVRDAVVATESLREQEALFGTAAYLSNRLFNPLQRLDVERLNDEIHELRLWLPVKSFLVVDTNRRLLTDGTRTTARCGEPIEGPFPSAAPWAPELRRGPESTEIRFAIRSGDVVAGWAVVTLMDKPLSAALRRLETHTARLWTDFRASLLYLAVLVLALTLLLGGLTSAWLSRSLVAPLLAMSRAARSLASGDLDHRLPDDAPEELGDLARALDKMVRDLKSHESERDRRIADLEAKNAELERFNYTVSHDLKSPLVTVLGFAGLIEADMSAGNLERAKDSLRRISVAGERMHRRLDDLLELSRVGRIVNPPDDVAMDALAREAVELVRGRLDEKGVKVEIAAELPKVRGDRQRLLEVLQNLLENSVKFMGQQQAPLVEIGVRQDGGAAVFYVKDNGRGLDPRHQQRLFRLFEKLDPGTEGTGVGLALARRIVEAHGGRIWAESEGLGHGSTFCFTVPGSEAQPRPREAADSPST